MIKWKEEYTMGIPLIDEQHKELFKIADKIFELLQDKNFYDKYDSVIELIEELKSYTVFHFESEEDYMKSIGYRKYLTHKVDHDDFIEKVSNVDFSKIDENQNAYILEILEFVVKWINDHILEKDKLITAG